MITISEDLKDAAREYKKRGLEYADYEDKMEDKDFDNKELLRLSLNFDQAAHELCETLLISFPHKKGVRSLIATLRNRLEGYDLD